MQSYHNILSAILDKGYDLPPAREQDIGTRQINNYLFQHDLREGFPLLTTKKVFTKGILVELLWFLRGETNIKPLLEQGVHIWTEWPYDHYVKAMVSMGRIPVDIVEFEEHILHDETFATMWGDCGPVYGAQWRTWKYSVDSGIGMSPVTIAYDQLKKLIDDIRSMITRGNHNRRMIVSAWNVGQIEEMKLPPCHKDFQVILEPIPTHKRAIDYPEVGSISDNRMDVVYSEEDLKLLDSLGVPKYYLNLTWNQRSVDTFLG